MGLFDPGTVGTDPTTGAIRYMPPPVASPVTYPFEAAPRPSSISTPATVDPGGTANRTQVPSQANVGTSYPYEPGKDPIYDAYLATFGYKRSGIESDYRLHNSQNQQSYGDAVKALDDAAGKSRTGLQTTELSRGIFKSGEARTREAGLEATVLSGKAAANTAYANNVGQYSSDMQRALAALDAEREGQVAQAITRVQTQERADKATADAAAAAAAAPVAAPAAVAAPVAPVVPVSTPFGVKIRTPKKAPPPKKFVW